MDTATDTTAAWGFIAQERAAVAEHGPFTDREQTHINAYGNRLCEDAARDFTEHLQSLGSDAYFDAKTHSGALHAKGEINLDLQMLADWNQAWVKMYAGMYAFDGTGVEELSPAATAYLTAEKARLDTVREWVHGVAFAFLLRSVRTPQ